MLLLEREACGLDLPDEEHLTLKIGIAGSVVDEVGRGVGDGPVQEPVGRGRHRQALRADLEREDLARHDPGARAPAAGEEEDVDTVGDNPVSLVEAKELRQKCLPDEGDERFLSRQVGVTSTGAHTRDDELADSHADGAEQ